MTCSKPFSLTVAPAACCLVSATDIPVVAAPGGICYDPDDNFIFASLGAAGAPPVGDKMVIINAATDTVVTTITGIGVNPVQSVYSPINNRVYAISTPFSDVVVIDPVLQAVDTILTPPVGIDLTSSSPEYDLTNNKIYFLAIDSGSSDIYILSLDPLTNIFSTLATVLDPSPDTHLWGLKPAYCPVNNRIYAPYSLFGGSTAPFILVFSAAGALVDTIAIPGATGADGLEQLHFSSTTGFLYYLGLHAVSDDSGFILINPSDNSFAASIAIGGTAINYATISPDCTSLCIYLSTNFLSQFNAETGAFLCTSDLATLGFGIIQLATGPDGKVYVPRGTVSDVRVFEPPP